MTGSRITIVNDRDELIGYKERGSLANTDIYRVSALWITNSNGDILLAQRKMSKKHDPGKWGPAVAGTVDEGETYDSNIIKEAKEEIGLEGIKPTKGIKQFVNSEYTYFCQWYMLVVDKPAETFVIQEEEVERVQWFTLAKLSQDLIEHPGRYLPDLDRAMQVLP